MAWTSIGKFEWPILWSLIVGAPNFARRNEDNTFRDVVVDRGNGTGVVYFGAPSANRYLYLDTGGRFVFGSGTGSSDVLIYHSGNLAAALANHTGEIRSRGTSAGLATDDRTTGTIWTLYATGGTWRLWNSISGDTITTNTLGQTSASFFRGSTGIDQGTPNGGVNLRWNSVVVGAGYTEVINNRGGGRRRRCLCQPS